VRGREEAVKGFLHQISQPGVLTRVDLSLERKLPQREKLVGKHIEGMTHCWRGTLGVADPSFDRSFTADSQGKGVVAPGATGDC
jgi:hypothetical protein